MSELLKHMFSKEQIVKNWTASGLLEGLPKEKIEQVAINLEQMALQCLQELPSHDLGRLDTIAFPVVRRVSQKADNVNVPHLWDYLKEAYKKEGWISEAAMNAPGKNDPEAEWTATICEEYIQKFHTTQRQELSEEKKRMIELAGIIKS